jgi:uncharacterized protein (DUF697 family)
LVDTEKTQQVIKQHMVWAVGAGMVPVPLVDYVAVSAIQMDLIRQLCTLHGVNYAEGTGKVWVSALTGGALARMGASAIKAIPGVGSLLGGISMAIASGASTYALGQVVCRHLDHGGNMSNLNMDEARKAYDASYEEGKKAAKEAQKAKGTGAGDTFSKLEKLGALRDKGVITAAEFEEQKKRLLESL